MTGSILFMWLLIGLKFNWMKTIKYLSSETSVSIIVS